jgi:two-component system response regulator VicR
MKILLVDDDRELVDLLTFAFGRAGFEVLPAHDSPSALRHLERGRPDLAVLDVTMGKWDGFELLRELRHHSDLPVILLTARSSEDDKVRGLELGADDYVTKPFSHRELIARVRANLRRRGHDVPAREESSASLQVGPIYLNPTQHAASIDGRPLELTVTEFRLLHYLMTRAGTVVPTRAVLRHVWGYDDPGGTDVVRVTIHRLRRKIEPDPSNPRLLHTVPGVGVMIKPEL